MCVCVCVCVCVCERERERERVRVSECVSIVVYLWDFRYECTYHMCVCHNGVFVLFCFRRTIFLYLHISMTPPSLACYNCPT